MDSWWIVGRTSSMPSRSEARKSLCSRRLKPSKGAGRGRAGTPKTSSRTSSNGLLPIYGHWKNRGHLSPTEETNLFSVPSTSTTTSSRKSSATPSSAQNSSSSSKIMPSIASANPESSTRTCIRRQSRYIWPCFKKGLNFRNFRCGGKRRRTSGRRWRRWRQWSCWTGTNARRGKRTTWMIYWISDFNNYLYIQ